jgi:hypothetical protein
MKIDGANAHSINFIEQKNLLPQLLFRIKYELA